MEVWSIACSGHNTPLFKVSASLGLGSYRPRWATRRSLARTSIVAMAATESRWATRRSLARTSIVAMAATESRWATRRSLARTSIVAMAANESRWATRRSLARTSIVAMAANESRADDSSSFDMSLDSALKLLGVSESASFDDILRAKNSISSSSQRDPLTIAQVEAAYDMLLMHRLTQRQAGKVVNNSIRYADVKPVSNQRTLGTMPQWLQSTMKASSVSIDKPASSDLGLQVGVYGAFIILTYINGMSSPSTGLVAGADVPGWILAASFGASLYFMTKKNVKLGKAGFITVGGLVAGAIVGSVVENLLHVDIVPFLGLHSPAAVVSEFILVSQLFVSLYLR